MSAAAIPKTVLAGTAISVIRMVSQSAWIVSGFVSASQTGPRPSSKVRKKMSPIGKIRSSAR